MTLWSKFHRLLRLIFYQLCGVKCDGKAWLQRIEIPRNHYDISLGHGTALDQGVALIATGTRQSQPRIRIGHSTYINRYTIIDASEQIKIGEHCLIGPHCYITDHDHEIQSGLAIKEQPLVGRPTVIGSHVWIGAGVIILKGVTIGNHAVIAAGAVVTSDVKPHSISAGVPNRTLRERISK